MEGLALRRPGWRRGREGSLSGGKGRGPAGIPTAPPPDPPRRDLRHQPREDVREAVPGGARHRRDREPAGHHRPVGAPVRPGEGARRAAFAPRPRRWSDAKRGARSSRRSGSRHPARRAGRTSSRPSRPRSVPSSSSRTTLGPRCCPVGTRPVRSRTSSRRTSRSPAC